jgi:hypothetical protein
MKSLNSKTIIKILQFSVKSGEHGTSTLSLVQNRVKCTTFLCQTEFDPGRFHCCYIYFHCSYMYNYYSYLEPCALNADF